MASEIIILDTSKDTADKRAVELLVKMMIVHDDEEWRLKRKKHQLEE